MAKRALVVLSEGFEDIEAVAPIDIMTRAGVEVTICSLKPGPVRAAYGSRLESDITIEQVDELYDAVVIPGGATNARNLAHDVRVVQLVHRHLDAGNIIAAICASPGLVLAQAAGILEGRKATGDPDFAERLREGGAEVTDEDITVDDGIITARGPGAAIQFGLKLAERLGGAKTAADLVKRWRINR